MITSEAGPFAIVPVWLMSKGLQPAAILTYIALASFANAETGQAHPKQQQIADRAGLKLDTVNKALGALEAAGIVDREKWFTTSGDIGGCHYLIRVIDPSPQENAGGVPDSHPVGVPDHSPVPTGPPSGTYRTTVRNKKQTKQQTKEEKKTSSSSSRGTRVPDDFTPTDQMKEWARTDAPGTGINDHNEFMDYWRAQPGQRGVKTDWTAVWRNWMRKASRDRTARPAVAGTRARVSATERSHAEIDDVFDRVEAEQHAALNGTQQLQLGGTR